MILDTVEVDVRLLGLPNVVILSRDGDQWCALLGANLQEGHAGFGDSPADALRALANDLAWRPVEIPAE